MGDEVHRVAPRRRFATAQRPVGLSEQAARQIDREGDRHADEQAYSPPVPATIALNVLELSKIPYSAPAQQHAARGVDLHTFECAVCNQTDKVPHALAFP